MPIKTTCPKCGKTFSLREELVGKAVRCPCGKTIQVPPANRQAVTEPISPAGAASSSTPGRSSSLRILVGCGVAGALLFAFVLTVALVVYISVTSTEQAKNPEAAVNLPAEREEPSRSVGEREPNRETPDRPATPNAEAPRAEAPPTEGLSKTLASMDRLTIAIAPPQEDDTPTPEVWTGHTASIRGVAYTHDGRFVVSVSGAIQKD